MKIAGIYPFEDAKDAKTQNIYGEPIGLELVLANAEREGHEAKLFLPVKETGKGIEKKDIGELVDEVQAFGADVAALSMYTCQFPFGKKIAERLKQKMPGLRIVAGNRHATTNYRELAQPFDFYVLGEGEQTFVELLHEMGNGGNYNQVKGIAFKANGQLVITGSRPFVENLDSLPIPSRSPLLLNQPYKGLGFPAAGKRPRIAIVEYSRGCNGFCKFCDNSLVWRRCIRFKSGETIVREMSELKKKGVGIFYYMDLNFTTNKEKVKEFCDAVKSRGEDFNWYCMSNIDTAKPKVLKMIKEAGCFKVNYGVESTNDESLKQMKKGHARHSILRKKQCISVLKRTQKTGLMAGGYYIIGFPWETGESILQDSTPLKDYAIHCLNVGIATPHPGTAWRNEFKERDLINKWENYDRRHLCYKHKSLKEKELQGIQAKICDDFYRNNTYIANVRDLVSVEPRFRKSFNDYFEILGMSLEV